MEDDENSDARIKLLSDDEIKKNIPKAPPLPGSVPIPNSQE